MLACGVSEQGMSRGWGAVRGDVGRLLGHPGPGGRRKEIDSHLKLKIQIYSNLIRSKSDFYVLEFF
jgi:hypothetical protein